MMSGDQCNRAEETLQNSDDTAEHPQVAIACSTAASQLGSSRSNAGSVGLQNNSDSPRNQDDMHKKDGVSGSPKKGLKFSKNELLDSAEFNKTIATWFGEKGFIAMRSFFRANVLNSLQKDPIGLSPTNCSDMDVMIVTLISDYLVKNGKYFTMSVFSNEVLRPLVNSNPNLKQVLLRIGKCEVPGEPTLTRETVSFVLRTLDIQTHSMQGAGILHKYLEDRAGDLLSVLMGLLRDNAPILNVKEQAVRDDDVVAAFSEGLQEEMGKLHCWFSNFNHQFVDVSGKLRQLICSQTVEDGARSKNCLSGQDEQELWDRMVTMDEHLKKQQECLMKMRDKERRKLATYAKELEDLHQEMNLKLKSIQDYEKTLKIREKALRENEAMGVASTKHRGRGDQAPDIAPKSGCWSGMNARYTQVGPNEAKPVSTSMTGQIMEENLELRSIIREQNLRIEALTKKASLLSCVAGCNGNKLMTSQLHNPSYGDIMTSHMPSHGYGIPVTQREVLHPKSPRPRKPAYPKDRLVPAMSSALRRARLEIDSLRDEQNTTDLQYDRLLYNKLSKRL